MIGGDESSCLSCSFCFGMFCRLRFAGSVTLASPQAAVPPSKSPYLTPWSERSGDVRRGLRPSVWLKILKNSRGLASLAPLPLGSIPLAPLRAREPSCLSCTSCPSCLSCSFCFGMFCRLRFAGSVALASPQAAIPPRKSPYLTPWSERSGDVRRGLRPSVWLKNSKNPHAA